MEKYKEIERSIITRYRKTIWSKFIRGITEYKMVEDGDKIAVCISGGKDSMLLAKCFQELKKHSETNFDVVYIVMNPGYNELNKQKIISNAELLNVPINMFETDIFNRVVNIEDNPCYLCARMRRGYLYEKAKELFNQTWNKEPIRLIGLRATDFTDSNNFQLSLFEDDIHLKDDKTEKLVEDINNKFGRNIIKKGIK